MLMVSVDGKRMRAKNVVLFNDDVPIAAASENSGSIMWADSARDPNDLSSMLASIGIGVGRFSKLDEYELKGDL